MSASHNLNHRPGERFVERNPVESKLTRKECRPFCWFRRAPPSGRDSAGTHRNPSEQAESPAGCCSRHCSVNSAPVHEGHWLASPRVGFIVPVFSSACYILMGKGHRQSRWKPEARGSQRAGGQEGGTGSLLGTWRLSRAPTAQ
ncbi:transcription initiation factor TFIID subunit 10 [Platysternon megacephalum]|uniref:Transcription initiation factor TFIID subunit 10 n=1 Tax=Platysternon megacephalum TaxID=55544 RepID=A0A4D9DIE9_9SAUR|nr:transcription initiation factor TFIID subunit 10 [Platysternon megacephalum]